LKGQTQRKATIQEAREDTLKLELFLDEVGHFIREKMDKQTKLNGPEGMVFDKTVQYIGLISKSLLFLQEEMESTSNVNLQSFLTGQVEHFHSTTHLRFDTPTMAQHARKFYETVKESIKRICNWSAIYYTHSKYYYPVPDNAIQRSEQPEFKKSTPIQITDKERRLMLDWGRKTWQMCPPKKRAQ
jgi:hypothetical protein